jgi:hypothetical protein
MRTVSRTTSGPDGARLQDAYLGMVSHHEDEAEASFTKCADHAAATLAGYADCGTIY